MFKKLFSKKPKEVIPDRPLSFGYKNQWLALKTNDQEKVAKFLKLRKVEPSNWKEGLNHGYGKGVFITPEIKAWTLVLGYDLSDLESEGSQRFLEEASLAFGECQAFFTHRVVDYHYWGKAQEGKIERLYSFVGEIGENIIIDGPPTPVETSLNLVNTFSSEAEAEDYFEREDLHWPDEETVMQVAEAWSINPTKIYEMENLSGLGLIGR